MANSFSFSSVCIFESDDVTQKSSVGSRTDEGPYFQMHNARLASSCILPAQHKFHVFATPSEYCWALCRQLTVPTYLFFFAEFKPAVLISITEKDRFTNQKKKIMHNLPHFRSRLVRCCRWDRRGWWAGRLECTVGWDRSGCLHTLSHLVRGPGS